MSRTASISTHPVNGNTLFLFTSEYAPSPIFSRPCLQSILDLNFVTSSQMHISPSVFSSRIGHVSVYLLTLQENKACCSHNKTCPSHSVQDCPSKCKLKPLLHVYVLPPANFLKEQMFDAEKVLSKNLEQRPSSNCRCVCFHNLFQLATFTSSDQSWELESLSSPKLLV